MNVTTTYKNPQKIYENWQIEHRELEKWIHLMTQWMRQVSERGNPRFGEAATRLAQLRSYLILHFDHENDLCNHLMNLVEGTEAELDAVKTQATADHQGLLDQLDTLIEQLNALDPPFASWQVAMDQVRTFAGELNLHEARESDAILTLIKGKPR
jgi:iron-sulfur cluster repair protein YtfE (RIC family)